MIDGKLGKPCTFVSPGVLIKPHPSGSLNVMMQRSVASAKRGAVTRRRTLLMLAAAGLLLISCAAMPTPARGQATGSQPGAVGRTDRVVPIADHHQHLLSPIR